MQGAAFDSTPVLVLPTAGLSLRSQVDGAGEKSDPGGEQAQHADQREQVFGYRRLQAQASRMEDSTKRARSHEQATDRCDGHRSLHYRVLLLRRRRQDPHHPEYHDERPHHDGEADALHPPHSVASLVKVSGGIKGALSVRVILRIL